MRVRSSQCSACRTAGGQRPFCNATTPPPLTQTCAVFAEAGAQVSKTLGQAAALGWPVVSIPAGETAQAHGECEWRSGAELMRGGVSHA